MHRWWPAAILLVAVTAATAHAQLDCDTPDDLCTGDPCVIGSVEVDDSCVLDFRPRALVIAGTLRMPNSGELTLDAASVDVRRGAGVSNLPLGSGIPGPGPRITLRATAGIIVDGSIRLSGVRGGALPGMLDLDAGGTLDVDGAVRVVTTPTTVRFAAGAAIVFGGRVNTTRPDVDVTAVAGTTISANGRLRRPERITMTAGGDVTLLGTIAPRTELTVDSGGAVLLGSTIRSSGTQVALRGATEVQISRPVVVLPLFLAAGSAEFTSTTGPVNLLAPVQALDVSISAGTDVFVEDPISASPPARSGGSITIESTGGNVETDTLRAQSGDGTQPGDGAGGQVRVTAAGDVVVPDVFVNAFPGHAGAPGGTVELIGASVAAFGTYDADGDTPGPDFPGAPPAGFRFTATAGSMLLNGSFHARGGPSVIQATALAHVDASGDYRVAPDGCIGLDAGGTLTTSGATFDTPPVTTCP